MRSLTVASDKLIAIAGLAVMVGANIPEKTDSIYVAGIFVALLPGYLLWSTLEFGSFCVRACLRRALTWSWALVDGYVYYDSLVKYCDGEKAWLSA